jgi:Fe2+ or Zn2+ uptake regulation protein
MTTSSDSADQNFITLLKDRGERITTPRLAIFRILSKHNTLTMPKLTYRAKHLGVDTVTVYRTISLFKKLSLVQEVGVGSRRFLELSDGFGAHHHHFWCVSCGKIIDFDDPDLETALHQATDRMGILLDSHQLEMVGKCPDCMN